MKDTTKLWIAIFFITGMFGFISINNIIHINKCYEHIKELKQDVVELRNDKLTSYQRSWVAKQASNAYCSTHECK